MAVRVELQTMLPMRPVVSRTPPGPTGSLYDVSLAPEDAVAFTTGEMQSTCEWEYGYDATNIQCGVGKLVAAAML